MWKEINLSGLIAVLEGHLIDYGLPQWGQAEFSRDALAAYCNFAGRPYSRVGEDLCVHEVNERAVKKRHKLARQEDSSLPEWEVIGSHLIQHENNRVVFDQFVKACESIPSESLHLWYAGSLVSLGKKHTCFRIETGSWSEFCSWMDSLYPWWMSFEKDKALFSPAFDFALVACHQGYFELAAIAGDPGAFLTKMASHGAP